MDHVVLDLRLALEVGINHLADGRCPICKSVIHDQYKTCQSTGLRYYSSRITYQEIS